LLIFLGCGLSLYLNQISGPKPEAKEGTPAWVTMDLLPHLPPCFTCRKGLSYFGR